MLFMLEQPSDVRLCDWDLLHLPRTNTDMQWGIAKYASGSLCMLMQISTADVARALLQYSEQLVLVTMSDLQLL